MKYMLLVHQGTTSTQPSERWERLSGDEQNAVGVAYDAINETPSHHPSLLLEPPAGATTTRVQDGTPLTTDGAVVEIKESIGGWPLFEADDLDAATGPASRIPAARTGGAVDVGPAAEWS